MDILLQFDSQATQFINELIPHTKLLDFFFSFFSLAGSSLFVWVLVIILMVVIEEIFHPGIQKRDIKFMLYFFVSFIITVLLTDIIIKNIIYRPRPFMAFHMLANCPHDSSFPSSHAATAFASALVLSVFDKKRKRFYYFIAILISLSRIYLQCHYIIDVVTGVIIGTLVSKIILQLHLHLSRNKRRSR